MSICRDTRFANRSGREPSQALLLGDLGSCGSGPSINLDHIFDMARMKQPTRRLLKVDCFLKDLIFQDAKT
jgi:hypothetical protein